MKDSNAATAIRIRLSYDWVVHLYLLLCFFTQIICKDDSGIFPYLVLICVYIEVFSVWNYRKLQKGGEAFHGLSCQTLTQDSSVVAVAGCMALDFALLAGVSLPFLVSALRHCAK
jgi:hypothetical protein